jgi:hypothetical protein
MQPPITRPPLQVTPRCSHILQSCGKTTLPKWSRSACMSRPALSGVEGKVEEMKMRTVRQGVGMALYALSKALRPRSALAAAGARLVLPINVRIPF